MAAVRVMSLYAPYMASNRLIRKVFYHTTTHTLHTSINRHICKTGWIFDRLDSVVSTTATIELGKTTIRFLIYYMIILFNTN